MKKIMLNCLVFMALCTSTAYSQTYSVDPPVDLNKPGDKHFAGMWQAKYANKTYILVLTERQINLDANKVYAITGSVDIKENGMITKSRKQNGYKSFLVGFQGNKEGTILNCIIKDKQENIYDQASLKLDNDFTKALWINDKLLVERRNYSKSDIPDSLVFHRVK